MPWPRPRPSINKQAAPAWPGPGTPHHAGGLPQQPGPAAPAPALWIEDLNTHMLSDLEARPGPSGRTGPLQMAPVSTQGSVGGDGPPRDPGQNLSIWLCPPAVLEPFGRVKVLGSLMTKSALIWELHQLQIKRKAGPSILQLREGRGGSGITPPQCLSLALPGLWHSSQRDTEAH